MDEQTFYSVYDDAARALRAYIARTLGDASQVDDLLQESFLKLLRTPSYPDDPRQLRLLLFRIASRLVADEWRRRGRAARASLEATFVPRSNPDSLLRLDMIRMFQQLRPQERQMLWLAYVEGANRQEIADALELREGSVRVMLHRARRKLASLLKAGAVWAEP
jgi:RNA polymerase sigma-70 factor (ECF subfamily)